MSCDHQLANKWAHCSEKNASYITMLIKKMITDATKTPNWQPQEEDQRLKCSFSTDL